MSKPPLRTAWTEKVLAYLLDQHGTGGVFGLEIINAEGIRSGTLYPILARLEEAGWVTSNWEDANVAAKQHRPPRRYYRLTGTGETNARAYCESFNGAPSGRQPHASGAPA
jgi:PadR family transcriptional regulator PadR